MERLSSKSPITEKATCVATRTYLDPINLSKRLDIGPPPCKLLAALHHVVEVMLGPSKVLNEEGHKLLFEIGQDLIARTSRLVTTELELSQKT